MEFISIREAAEKWGISVRRVQDLCRAGRIPGVQTWGRGWMIPSDAVRPADGRRKNPDKLPMPRKSPFLDMTDLYTVPGTADACAEKLADNPEAQALFSAEIAYCRGQIGTVYAQAQEILANHSGLYAVLAGGMLLSLCAMWQGDDILWRKAKHHICEAPCRTTEDLDILTLALASADSAIRNTNDFPDWFCRGCFEKLPGDARPAARVYYIKYLLICAQNLAAGHYRLEDVTGLGLMRSIPYIAEPLIAQTALEKCVVAEIYLRLLCAVAYQQYGDKARAIAHIDRAIALALPDMLLGILAEHRRQLGLLLDERLMLADPDAFKKYKSLHKHLHEGWVKLHNIVLKRKVSAALSTREREVTRLVSFGLTNSQIAHQLHISEATVKSLIVAIRNKTGAVRRSELADYI